jgi:hypothetical protein
MVANLAAAFTDVPSEVERLRIGAPCIREREA